MSFILVGSLPPEKTPRKPSYQGLKQYSNQLFYLFNVDRGKTSKAISFVRLNNHTNTSLPALRNDDDFSLLITACSLHTSARTHDDITVQACFDSDIPISCRFYGRRGTCSLVEIFAGEAKVYG
jgi:hypothetical protein